MANLFFYNRISTQPDPNDKDKQIEKSFRDCLNLDKILRVVQFEPDLIVVVMDDGHEDKVDVPIVVKGRQETQTVRRFTQTEIGIKGKEQVDAFYAKYDK